jgi:hypothetical protein
MIAYPAHLSKSIADAAAGLKAKIGDVEGLNDDDDDDGGNPSSSGVELGNRNDDTIGHVTSSSLTTSVTPHDSDSVNVEAASNVNLPENSTDINNWSNLDDSFWDDLVTQLDTLEVSGGNPNLPPLPPYPHSNTSALSIHHRLPQPHYLLHLSFLHTLSPRPQRQP